MGLVADYLPGAIVIEQGTIGDYRRLEQFHYARTRPATWAGVWRAVYRNLRLATADPFATLATLGTSLQLNSNCRSRIANCKFDERVVAVAVLSYPTPAHRIRERELGLSGPRYGEKLKFVNQHVRTISRVIVHPQFRGIGLASELVRRVCDECPTRYVEAIARMGEVHPFFEKGGMRKVAGDGESPGYFLWRRPTRKNR